MYCFIKLKYLYSEGRSYQVREKRATGWRKKRPKSEDRESERLKPMRQVDSSNNKDETSWFDSIWMTTEVCVVYSISFIFLFH